MSADEVEALDLEEVWREVERRTGIDTKDRSKAGFALMQRVKRAGYGVTIGWQSARLYFYAALCKDGKTLMMLHGPNWFDAEARLYLAAADMRAKAQATAGRG